MAATTKADLREKIHTFIRQGYTPHLGRPAQQVGPDPRWQRLTHLGTELWLDTGSIDDIDQYWSPEFRALTTNNTLLNREVQKGTYDAVIPSAGELLGRVEGMTARERGLEMAFILNAMHGLKLVDRFDAYVSVEEHTDLAADLPGAIEYGRRLHAICPERFMIKLPFTPAGVLATRALSSEGILVNHTLGFSGRQSYVATRLAHPAYVNVFLGRLGSFVRDNELGDGRYVGEKATLASQAVVSRLRTTRNTPTLQIGASFRDGRQVVDLGGIDVMTIPPKVAGQYLSLCDDDHATCPTSIEYEPTFREGVIPERLRMETLWEVELDLVECVDEVLQEHIDTFTADDLVGFFHERGCGDIWPRWTSAQVATSAAEGKIPRLSNWEDALGSGEIGLDSLMNLAGLNSFTADQRAMDDRIETVLTNARSEGVWRR